MSPAPEDAPGVQVLDAVGGPELSVVEAGGTATAVIWPGMGADLRSMFRLSLARGGSTVRLTHPSDAVYYVISGSGEIGDGGDGEPQALVEGSMVHVDAGTAYVLRGGPDGLEAVGGPAPADPGLYEAAGAGG